MKDLILNIAHYQMSKDFKIEDYSDNTDTSLVAKTSLLNDTGSNILDVSPLQQLPGNILSTGYKKSGDPIITQNKVTVVAGQNIQQAINAVHEAGGGIVYLEPGTHTVADDIVLYSGITIEGLSASDSIISFGLGAYQIQILGSNAYSTGTVTIANNGTTVEGAGGMTWTSAMVGRSIMLGGIWYPISGVTDADTLTLAIPYGGAALAAASYTIATIISEVKIENVAIKNSTASSIVKAQYCSEIFISNVDIQVGTVGLDFDDGSNLVIDNLDVVYTTTGDGLQMTNCHFTEIKASGGLDFAALGTGNAMTLSSCTNFSINACFFLNATGDGINLTSCDNIGIFGTNCEQNGGQGIELVSGNTNINMTAMGCFGNASDGIKLTATDDRNIITGCFLEDNGGYGINIAASTCDNNVILNNVYSSNVSGDLNDLGTGTIITGGQVFELSASNNLRVSADTERTEATTGYVKEKDITIQHRGTVRVKFDLKGTGGDTAYGRIYVNGVAVGTERTTTETAYQTYSEDIAVLSGDEVQLYIKTGTLTVPAYCRNFRIYYDKNAVADFTVNTD